MENNIQKDVTEFIKNTYKSYKKSLSIKINNTHAINEKLIYRIMNRIFFNSNIITNYAAVLLFKKDGSFVEYVFYPDLVKIDIEEVKSLSKSIDAKYAVVAVIQQEDMLSNVTSNIRNHEKTYKLINLINMKTPKLYAYYIYLKNYNKFTRIYEDYQA